MISEIDSTWQKALAEEFSQPYFLELTKLVNHAYQTGAVYPAQENIFAALKYCPLNQIKVVILGQDPYHGPNQAHGLAFSVLDGVDLPPSLRNIYKEISTDIGTTLPASGDLTRWAKQGVLLLNSVLTVEAGLANSHQSFGWERFTDGVLKKISANCSGVVFMLWGKQAQAKELLLDKTKHLVLKTSHPSPLSAYRGFFGCRHFSQCNQYLTKHHQTPINW